MKSVGRPLGSVPLSFPGRRELNEAEHIFLRLLADTCAMTIGRIEAQGAAADREAKLAFLAETSAKLASDLDYESTLTAVAEAAVPWFADWCAIALAEDGVLRTITVAHTHPERMALVQELQERYPNDPASDQGGYGVLREYQERAYGETTAVDLARPDFVAAAAAFGVAAAETTPERLGDDLAQALGRDAPSVLVLRERLRWIQADW